ncbi:MAG TPA: DUF4345 family protein [Prosthecobacter sp.]|nr:DUF4345 family protein [Prosthecobacter sp.]
MWERRLILLVGGALMFMIGLWAYREPRKFYPPWPLAERHTELINNTIRQIGGVWMATGILVVIFTVLRLLR